jgi:hypothetical protein
MPDDPTKRGPPDRDRIAVSDPNELRHWSKSLGVSEEKLKEAVQQVGTSADKVREYLAGRK